MLKSKIPVFKIFTVSALFFFSATIVLFIIADLSYIDKNSIVQVITSEEFKSAQFLSLLTSLITTLLSIAIAIPSAYALSRFPFKGIIVLDIIVDFLIVLPVLVIGVSLLVFFRLGNELHECAFWPLKQFGSLIIFLGDFFIYKKPGIVIAQFFCSASFAVRSLKGSFDSIDPRTEHVAMTRGCTRGGAFRRITLPMAKPGILAAMVLAWARAFEIFGSVAMVAGAVRRKTEILPTAIYLEFSIGRIEAALVLSLVMLMEAFIILFLMRFLSKKNIFGARGY